MPTTAIVLYLARISNIGLRGWTMRIGSKSSFHRVSSSLFAARLGEQAVITPRATGIFFLRNDAYGGRERFRKAHPACGGRTNDVRRAATSRKASSLPAHIDN